MANTDQSIQDWGLLTSAYITVFPVAAFPESGRLIVWFGKPMTGQKQPVLSGILGQELPPGQPYLRRNPRLRSMRFLRTLGLCSELIVNCAHDGIEFRATLYAQPAHDNGVDSRWGNEVL